MSASTDEPRRQAHTGPLDFSELAHGLVQRMTGEDEPTLDAVIDADTVLRAREVARRIYVDDKVKEYVLDIVAATRNPPSRELADLRQLVAYGASPRAGIYMVAAARAHAFIKGRGYVTPDDIKQLAPDILRHRVIASYEAEAQEITSADIVQRILDHVEVP